MRCETKEKIGRFLGGALLGGMFLGAVLWGDAREQHRRRMVSVCLALEKRGMEEEWKQLDCDSEVK